MIRKKYNKQRKDNLFVKANAHIHFPQVRVLTEHGEMVGIMSSREAFQQAMDEGKDLVLITEKTQPPVVKIIELSKFKYQLKKKEADNRKKSKIQDLKELRFSPVIEEGDYQTRLKQLREFLTKGHKVKITLFFRGRQIAYKEAGYEVFARIIQDTEDLAKVEVEPRLIGKKLQAQLAPLGKEDKK
ncbi:translation initiation factor IF-3 [Candidatus Woesebacteria bacterium]|nr:translation initiation factor IF-3 [Candidatus Woesebacteria bacterium]HOA11814.1 translation initiation factor IF-3 [Candidatus Woesebacteria bacterium]HOI05090.1 translation initiation factor IF-3 [Candidatus Woesebacteria bacterium]HOP38872.1 translation initiation factor IF-3 [Candidatus Woesebacteria bacterium]HPK08093.1 translation initiation factor IF-3 [Candidatus Woesebacteria bacterium]